MKIFFNWLKYHFKTTLILFAEYFPLRFTAFDVPYTIRPQMGGVNFVMLFFSLFLAFMSVFVFVYRIIVFQQAVCNLAGVFLFAVLLSAATRFISHKTDIFFVYDGNVLFRHYYGFFQKQTHQYLQNELDGFKITKRIGSRGTVNYTVQLVLKDGRRFFFYTTLFETLARRRMEKYSILFRVKVLTNEILREDRENEQERTLADIIKLFRGKKL